MSEIPKGLRVIRFHDEDGCLTAIAGDPGRLYTYMVVFDTPLRLRKVTNEEAAKFGTPLAHPPIKSAVRRVLAAGRRLGITEGAKNFLKDGNTEGACVTVPSTKTEEVS